MKLADQDFVEMLRGLVGDEATDACLVHDLWHGLVADERRRAGRRRFYATLPFTRYGTVVTSAQSVQTLDASTCGLGWLLSGNAMAPGEQVVVHSVVGPTPRGRKRGTARPAEVLCTVRTVRVRSDGTLRVGAEFTAPYEATLGERVTSMRAGVDGTIRFGNRCVTAADAASGYGTDRRELCPKAGTRAEERLPHMGLGRATMYVVHADGRHAPVEHVEVANFSTASVALLRGEPLDQDDHFMIRIPRPDDTPLTRLCCVVRTVQTAQRYLVAARYVPFDSRTTRSWLGRVLDHIF